VKVSENVLWLYHLFHLIPVNMFSLDNINSFYSINLLGLTVLPYELILIFAVAASIVLMPVVYRSYKKNN